MWGSAVECRQRGGSAAPHRAALGGVGGFNQADKFMGSESSPRYCRYAGLLEDFISNMGFQISLSNSEQVHFKAPIRLPEAFPICFTPSLSFPCTPNTPASSCTALVSSWKSDMDVGCISYHRGVQVLLPSGHP